MHFDNTAQIAAIQAEYGLVVCKRKEARPWGSAVIYREPLTGDETMWATPAVAVRRLLLPYFQVSNEDGDFLFNREYHLLWMRRRGLTPKRVTSAPASLTGQTTWFYSDATPEPERVTAGRRVCASWGLRLPRNLADLVVSV